MIKCRISKDPEIRKGEIIDVAAELFITQGFDETTVSDIVKKVGVAQGLFYYYFKSKDDILNAVVDHFTESYITEFKKIGSDSRMDSIEKLRQLMSWMISLTLNDKLVQYVHEERNELLHHRLAIKWLDVIVDIYLNIIEQGIREKVFEVEYPRETLEILMAGLEPFWHSAYRQFPDSEQFTQKYRVGMAVLEKALGAAPGSLQNIQLQGIGDNHE